MVTGVMHGPQTDIFLLIESTQVFSMIQTASSAMIISLFFEAGLVYTRDMIAKGKLICCGTDRYLIYYLNEYSGYSELGFQQQWADLLLKDFIPIFKEARCNYFRILAKRLW